MREPLLICREDLSDADDETKSSLLLLAGEYRRLNGEYKEARAWFQQDIEATPLQKRMLPCWE